MSVSNVTENIIWYIDEGFQDCQMIERTFVKILGVFLITPWIQEWFWGASTKLSRHWLDCLTLLKLRSAITFEAPLLLADTIIHEDTLHTIIF